MCCHPKRFKDSINELLDLLSDSKSFKQKICIHIDEIHEYIKKIECILKDGMKTI